jgi:hypothetical protein
LLVIRGGTSSFGQAALKMAVNAGVRVIATTRDRHPQTHVRRSSPIRGCLFRESAVAPRGMTDQGLEYRTAVLSGNHAKTLKRPQHQVKIVRHPAWHHPRCLALEGREVIAAVSNLLAYHGGPDRRYLRPGQRVGTDKLDCGAGQWMG